MTAFLLVARKNGDGSARRQRGFATRQDAMTALERWLAEGFVAWWLYGQPRRDGGARRLLRTGGAL